MHSRAFAVPAAIAGPNGNPSKLFELVGFGRPLRRKQPLSEGELAARLMFPEERLRRFWLDGYPRHAGRPPLVKGIDLPTIDLQWLRQYIPELGEWQTSEDSLLEQFPSLRDLEGRLRGEFPEFEKAGFRLDLRPFAIWERATFDLRHWDELTEEARQQVVGAIVALDGISGSQDFTNRARELAPPIGRYLHVFPGVGEPVENVRIPTTEDMTERADDSAVDCKGRWQECMREIKSICDSALDGEFYTQASAQLRSKVDELDQIGASWEAKRSAASGFGSALETIASTLLAAAATHGLAWLTQERVEAFVNAWHAAFEAAGDTRRAGIRESLENVAPDLEGQLQGLAARSEEHRGLFARQQALKNRMSAASPRERLEMRPEDRELQQSIIDAESQVTEIEAAIEAFLELRVNDVLPAYDTAAVERGQGSDTSVEETTPGGISTTDTVEGAAPRPTESPAPASPEPSADPGAAPDDEQRTVAQLDAPIAPSPLDASDEAISNQELPAGPDRFDARAGDACRPIWSAIRNGEPALAYQIAAALHDHEPDIDVPPLPLLKALALAPYLETSHGDIASAIRAACDQVNPDELNDGPDDWRIAMSLLTLAATLRACLIAPNTGATGVARYSHPSPALHELRESIIKTGERLQGLNVTRASFRETQTAADWDQLALELTRDIADWKRRAPTVWPA